MKTERELTQKQEKFCHYFVECGNASKAYRRAFSAANMKPETVNVKASELFNNGKVTVRVKELQGELQSKSNITKERVIDELAKIGFADIDNLHAKIKALESISRMLGFNEPAKIESTGISITDVVLAHYHECEPELAREPMGELIEAP
jgi:phage terminase small subunit